VYFLFKTRSREHGIMSNYWSPSIFSVPPIELHSHPLPHLLIISEWRVDGLTVTTSRVMCAILCIACFEGKGLLITNLRRVDPIHIGQSQSRRWSAANRNSARHRKCHPGLFMFVVFKAQIRPSSSQAYQRLREPMVSYRTHRIPKLPYLLLM
jgi:hypothetical protein